VDVDFIFIIRLAALALLPAFVHVAFAVIAIALADPDTAPTDPTAPTAPTADPETAPTAPAARVVQHFRRRLALS